MTLFPSFHLAVVTALDQRHRHAGDVEARFAGYRFSPFVPVMFVHHLNSSLHLKNDSDPFNHFFVRASPSRASRDKLLAFSASL